MINTRLPHTDWVLIFNVYMYIGDLGRGMGGVVPQTLHRHTQMPCAATGRTSVTWILCHTL